MPRFSAINFQSQPCCVSSRARFIADFGASGFYRYVNCEKILLESRRSGDQLSDRPGDYSYVKLEQDGTVRISDAWKLGWDVGVKAMDYLSLDAQGFSKDVLTASVGGTASLFVVKGTTIDAGVSGRFASAANATNSLSTWVMTAGFSSRLGGWLLSARCRSELRFPWDASLGTDTYTTTSVSLQWDPNR